MKHKKHKNLAQLNKEISNRLLNSCYLLEILEDIMGGEAKEGILIDTVKRNVLKSFDDIEKCRKIISMT